MFSLLTSSKKKRRRKRSKSGDDDYHDHHPPSPVRMILSPLVGTNESIVFIILTIIIMKVEKMKKQCV